MFMLHFWIELSRIRNAILESVPVKMGKNLFIEKPMVGDKNKNKQSCIYYLFNNDIDNDNDN